MVLKSIAKVLGITYLLFSLKHVPKLFFLRVENMVSSNIGNRM